MDKWKNRTIQDDGGFISDDFKQFAKDFKTYIKKQFQAAGFKLAKYSVNHYEVSGFVQKEDNQKIVYFSISDVRYFPFDWQNNVLVRSAESFTDFKGGMNHFAPVEKLAEEAGRLTK